jgi:hypothetical protein
MTLTTHTFTGPPLRLAVVCVLSLAALGTAFVQLGTAGASTAPSANLSVSQHVSNGSVKGQTTITAHIHNAGPSTAPSVDTVALVNTNSSSLRYLVYGAICEQQAAPPNWTFMFTCQGPSIGSGKTWKSRITVTGTQGATLTEFFSAADHGPADPSLANNPSTLNTYVGAESDLGLSQKATAGKSAGDSTITVTARNHGPWTANALQYVGEIKSATFRSVNASASTPTGSCQFIPPAAGYTKAFSCTTNSLAPGKVWTFHLAFAGTAKAALVLKGSVSANNPGDPSTANNSKTTRTHDKS